MNVIICDLNVDGLNVILVITLLVIPRPLPHT